MLVASFSEADGGRVLGFQALEDGVHVPFTHVKRVWIPQSTERLSPLLRRGSNV